MADQATEERGDALEAIDNLNWTAHILGGLADDLEAAAGSSSTISPDRLAALAYLARGCAGDVRAEAKNFFRK